MRSLGIAGLAAALALPAMAQPVTRIHDTPPAEEQPPPHEAPPAPQLDAPPDQSPAPRVEPAAPEDRPAPEAASPQRSPPDVSPWGDRLRPPEPEPKPKPKVKVDEAAGGVAGSLAAQVAGTAVAGPIGGIAASFVGGPVGSATVRAGKRVLGIGHKPAPEQAAAASERGVPSAATVRDPPEPALRPEDREEPAAPRTPEEAPRLS